MSQQKVFTFENAKTIKGESSGYITAIRYLAPADESGTNICPKAGACRDVCLYTAGRGAFASIKAARIAKTNWRLNDRAGRLDAAVAEIRAADRKARLAGMKLAVRVNGTSDLPADTRTLAAQFPGVRFYDYTKIVSAALNNTYCNVYYTLSYDAQTVPWSDCCKALERGINVAVVFATKRGAELPNSWNGVKVIDGDEHDLRFLDPRGVIVGLRAKGLARKLHTGFVVEV